MKIRHVNGDWYNEHNDCFGPWCVATTYDDASDMPEDICQASLQVFDNGDGTALYYQDGDLEGDAVASTT